MQIRVSTCLPLPVSRSRLRCLGKETRQTPWENKEARVFRGTLLRTNISHLGKITFPATFNGDHQPQIVKIGWFFEKHKVLFPKFPPKQWLHWTHHFEEEKSMNSLGVRSPRVEATKPKKIRVSPWGKSLGEGAYHESLLEKRLDTTPQQKMLFSNFKMNTLLF